MARPPFTFERNTLGANGSFPLRFIAGPPFAGVHLKNARHFTASLQEPRIKNACCSAALLTKGLTGRPTVNRPFVVCGVQSLLALEIEAALGKTKGPPQPHAKRSPGAAGLFAISTRKR